MARELLRSITEMSNCELANAACMGALYGYLCPTPKAEVASFVSDAEYNTDTLNDPRPSSRDDCTLLSCV